ncbi:bifunctional DNA primase/polymerase [Roseovarius atlanticus]|uniref:bifunctional DNA primase/polymerase n=1 Tax=Roseovarius atlanticus TaxID=1641875 RepID=UPI00070A9184|nr:bifunctional DNA primase/polymerase [Roseovarius atlanticus]
MRHNKNRRVRQRVNLECALAHAAAGIKIIPVRTKTEISPSGNIRKAKSPFITDWPARATTDAETIRAWFDKFPDAAPAIVTGEENGFDVLDIDVKKDCDGFEELRKLRIPNGALSPVLVDTPSGGTHYYFKHHSGLRNSEGELAPGIDVRADGGYVLAPGAVVEMGTYEVLVWDVRDNRDQLTDWPNQLVALFNGHKSEILKVPEGLSRRLRSALMAIPNDTSNPDAESRSWWLRIGAALHYETEGSEEGLELFHKWSMGWHDYDPDHTEQLWKSFGRKSGRPCTGATIFAEARRHGWYDQSLLDGGDGDRETNTPIDQRLQFLLDRYVAVRVGAAFAVLDKETAPEGKPFLTWPAFQQLYSHWISGSVRLTGQWATSPNREVYEKGVTFDPSGKIRRGAYNFWQGFPVNPEPGDSSVLTDFLFRDICGGDSCSYQLLMTHFAHLVQYPDDKPGVALVLKGPKGVGKDTAILSLRALVGAHYAYATSPEDVLGKFNVMLVQALVVHLEEATWGGDKRAAKKFQGLITSETLRVEPKGIDAYTTPNFSRFMLSTNDDWAVPASGEDERRYAVIEVPDHWADTSSRNEKWRSKKVAHFKRVHASIKDRATLAAWMHHLLFWCREDGQDLRTAVRLAPRNTALAEQKASGFGGLDAYWFDILVSGQLPDGIFWGEDGGEMATADLQSALSSWFRGRRGEGNPPGSRTIGKRLAKIAPSVRRERETSGERRGYYYRLPPLSAARGEFAKAHGVAFEDLYDEEAITARNLFELV